MFLIMNFENPLEPIYESFKVANNCFDGAAHMVKSHHKEFIDGISNEIAPTDDLITVVEDAKKQSAELAILALFATFERYVIDYLQTANRLLSVGHPKQYSTRLAEKFANEVEYWRFSEVLDLFKGEIDSSLIGQVKQVKQYRDWIAHRNPRARLSAAFEPEAAFDILAEMIEQIRFTHTLPADRVLIDSADLVAVT
jgi:hypothetical protein